MPALKSLFKLALPLTVAVLAVTGCGETMSPTRPSDERSTVAQDGLRHDTGDDVSSLGKNGGSNKSGSGESGKSESGSGSDFWASLQEQWDISWDIQTPSGNDPTTKWFQTVRIDAKTGGTNWFGRVSVEIPKGALKKDTDITVCIITEGLEFLDFELLPHGLQFNKPVTVRVNTHGLGLSADDDVTQYWWDEAALEFVDIGGQWNYPTMTSTLDHFSKYRTGRAGW